MASQEMSDKTTSDSSEESGSEVSDPELDIMSPHFNPLKALYAPKVKGLLPGVRTFASVAEYETTALKNKAAQSKSKSKTTQATGNVAEGQVKIQTPITSTSTQPEDPEPSTSRMKPRKSNLLKRMEEPPEGPLQLLKRCVNEKLKARVLTRGLNRIQSVYRGYIVAFDGYLNLAMIDVEETYRKHGPSSRRKKTRQSKNEPTTAKPVSAEVEPSQTSATERKVHHTPGTPGTETPVGADCNAGVAAGTSEPSFVPQMIVPAGAASRGRGRDSFLSSPQPSLQGGQQAPSDRGDSEQSSPPRPESVVADGSSSSSTHCMKPPPHSSSSQDSKLPKSAMPGSSRQSISSLPVKSSQSQEVRKSAVFLTDEEALGIRKSLIRHRYLGQIFIMGGNVVAVYVQE